MKKVKSRQPAAKVTRKSPRTVGSAKAKGRAKAKLSSKRATKSAGAKPAKGARRAKAVAASAKPAKGAKLAAPPKPELKIRELDPLRVCGDRTSVVQLFRVDEEQVGGRVAGARQVHLVFNDRHGWYCEHGRSCHAVSAVMRHARIR